MPLHSSPFAVAIICTLLLMSMATIPTSSAVPTSSPSMSPSASPTTSPSHKPTTKKPTQNPHPTTRRPSKFPTRWPTKFPSTRRPSKFPTRRPSLRPTRRPSKLPTTKHPSHSPTTRPTISVNVTTSITFQFITIPPTPLHAILNDARDKWLSILKHTFQYGVTLRKGSNPCGLSTPLQTPVSFDGVLIFVDITYIDGPLKILGRAGPCWYDPTTGIPRIGVMQLDSVDMLDMSGTPTGGGKSGTYQVMVHEMAHIFGIGSFWLKKNLESNANPPRYLGTNGSVGLQEIGGTGKPVIENLGGTGTAFVHWKEAVYGIELMTPYLNSGYNPLSRLTVRSLVDLGWNVDETHADTFSISQASARVSSSHLRGSVIPFVGCEWIVDPDKRVVRDIELFVNP